MEAVTTIMNKDWLLIHTWLVFHNLSQLQFLEILIWQYNIAMQNTEVYTCYTAEPVSHN